MKRFTRFAVVLMLMTGLTSMVSAATSTSGVTVEVQAIDLLYVSDGGTIILNSEDVDWEGIKGETNTEDLVGEDSDATARLYFMHNSGSKKITAQVSSAPSTDNDITMTVAVQGGTGAQTLYSDGSEEAAQDVRTGINPGLIWGQTVTYSAKATSAGTAPATYDFVVTFTSVDE